GRASGASEPRDRSEPAQRRARERVGESEGRSPSDESGVRSRGLARADGRRSTTLARGDCHLPGADAVADGGNQEGRKERRPRERETRGPHAEGIARYPACPAGLRGSGTLGGSRAARGERRHPDSGRDVRAGNEEACTGTRLVASPRQTKGRE